MIKSLIKKTLYEKNIASLISNVAVAFTGLVSFMLLTRGLSKELFGEWVLYVTLASFVDLLRFGLTRTSVVRFLSGADDEKQKVLLGTSFRVNLVMVFAITVICWLLAFILLYFKIELNNGYLLFLKWYPLLAIANLSWNNASALFQAQQKFKRMMNVQMISVGSFVLFLILNNYWLHYGMTMIIIVQIAGNLVAGFWCTLKKWDGLAFLKLAQKEVQKELLHFGKYSMGTLIGSSLLKSADTFIIGLSPVLGSAGIAMFAIPMKLTDLLGIPLRSFSMTAYPRMSKKSIEGDTDGVRKVFYSYSGAITLLFIPVSIFGFIFAKQLVLFLGGNEYIDSIELLTTIFRIFTFYTLLLPIDRFTGVVLDSINRPHINLNKVIMMALANIIVDIIGVFVFHSLEIVAIGTVLFTFFGVLLGIYYLKKEIQIQSKYILSEGIQFFKNVKNFY
jgi:O-antigen/teichoic acid export membrane protein